MLQKWTADAQYRNLITTIPYTHPYIYDSDNDTHAHPSMPTNTHAYSVHRLYIINVYVCVCTVDVLCAWLGDCMFGVRVSVARGAAGRMPLSYFGSFWLVLGVNYRLRFVNNSFIKSKEFNPYRTDKSLYDYSFTILINFQSHIFWFFESVPLSPYSITNDIMVIVNRWIPIWWIQTKNTTINSLHKTSVFSHCERTLIILTLKI